MAEMARERGIGFELTPVIERQLREAGATDSLEATLRELAAKRPAPPPPKVRKPTSPNPVPLAKAELLQMLKSMSSGQVTALVTENGVSFAPTPDDLKEIRQAGGADDLIQAVTELAPSKSG